MTMDQEQQNIWRQFFTTHIFSFGKREMPTYTDTLFFEANGKVGGYESANERYWHIDEDGLHMQNDQHNDTTMFELESFTADKIDYQLFEGHYLKNDSVVHELRVQTITDFYANQLNAFSDRMDDIVRKGTRSVVSRELRNVSTQAQKIRTQHKIRLAFIINSLETLPALMPLITKSLNDPRFEVKIMVTDKYYLGMDSLGTYDDVARELDDRGIEYINAQNYHQSYLRLKRWQADFIVRQSEWDADFSNEFSGNHLNWSRLVYVPYIITESFIKSPDSDEDSLLTNEYYENVWRYFVPSQLTDDEQAKIKRTFISQEVFSPVGSMKAIEIKNAKPKWPLDMTGRDKKVVWMAHHSIGSHWFNMGSFPKIYKQMLDWADSHPTISVLFNPHPLLEEIIKSGEYPGYTVDDYHDFLKQWDQLPNTGVLINEPQYNATAAADAIFTDGISSLYEMQIQNKPIVSIARHDQENLTTTGEKLMTGVHTYYTMDEVFTELEYLLNHDDDKLKVQQQNVRPWVKNEHPEVAIIEQMVQEMNGDSQ